jgi:hypothetical protein
MRDRHLQGLIATLDPDNAKHVTRQPKGHVRMIVVNGRCSDAHAVEIEAQQKADGTMEVEFVRHNARTNERDVIFRMIVPEPGELWTYEKIERDRAAVRDGS